MFVLKSNPEGLYGQVIFLDCSCRLEAQIWAKRLSEYLGHPFTLVDIPMMLESQKTIPARVKNEVIITMTTEEIKTWKQAKGKKELIKHLEGEKLTYREKGKTK